MGQKPNEPAYSKDRVPPQFEEAERRRAHAAAPAGGPILEPIPSAAGAVSGPFHDEGPLKVSRRNPTLTLTVIGGLIAIIALVIGMLFSAPSWYDDKAEMPQTMQFKARR